MNAINHTATALLINKKWPGVPIIPALISVQLIEIFWVILNFVGIEFVTTEVEVASLADIHLAHMPWSHSMVMTSMVALAVWALFAWGFKKPLWGLALAAGVMSHIILDLFTHAPDIAFAPGIEGVKYGTGFYAVPLVAFLVEFIYGLVCWWAFKGSRALLIVIVLFNVTSLSFYWAAMPGPESLFAGAPLVFVGLVTFHIIAAWVAIWYFAKKDWVPAS